MAGDEQQAAAAELNTVSVKLPEFWVANPNLWFKQAEAAFRRARITSSSTKYDYVLMKLPPDVMDAVADIINQVEDDTADPYEQLKTRLSNDFGMSKWQQVARLVEHPGLGDSRPSALMAQLLALLPPGEKAGTLFQYHFLRHLPADMRSILVAAKIEDARTLATQADLLWDARGSDSKLHAISARQASPTARRRSPSRDHHRRSSTPGRLCFYHGRFGDEARRCQKPCSWAGNSPAAGSN